MKRIPLGRGKTAALLGFLGYGILSCRILSGGRRFGRFGPCLSRLRDTISAK